MSEIDVALIRWAVRTAGEFKTTPTSKLDDIASKPKLTLEDIRVLSRGVASVSDLLQGLAESMRNAEIGSIRP